MMDEIKHGDELTVIDDVVNPVGKLILQKGQKVRVLEVDIKKSFWGAMSGVYYPEKVVGIRLVGYRGIWRLETFEELCR